jgi:ABC-type multidrug transport system fused ATPase/permease subunit
MSFAQQVLLTIPTIILGLIIIGGAVILTIIGLLIMRRFVPHHKLKSHNDVSGPIFGTLGVVYAVLLAFIVVIVWQNFDKSDANVQQEENCVIDLWRDAAAFSPDFKKEVRGLFKEYAQVIVQEEWDMLARGDYSRKAGQVVNKIWSLYSNYQPRDMKEMAFFQESIKKLNEFGELRLMRLMDARKGVHPILWFVLITGGIVTIAFTFFFGAESLNTQMAMSVLLAMIISLILFTVLMLDYPFTGDVKISPETFKLLLEKMK